MVTSTMSTTTLETLIDTQINTAWGYITTTVEAVWPFAIGIAVLSGVIWFVTKRTKFFG